jgi:hypothetical protein
MTIRVTCLLAAALGVAAPVAAQRSVEVGAFARYADFDNTLAMGSTVAVGARAGLSLGPAVTLELDVARASSQSVTQTPLHLRLVHVAPLAGRISSVTGAGYVRNWYGAPYRATDGGVSVLLGLEYRTTDRMRVRLGADLDAMFHTSHDSPFAFYNGNWGLQLGAGMRLTR